MTSTINQQYTTLVVRENRISPNPPTGGQPGLECKTVPVDLLVGEKWGGLVGNP